MVKRMRIKKLLIRKKMVKKLLTVLETTTTIIKIIFLKVQNPYLGNKLMKMRIRKLDLQAIQLLMEIIKCIGILLSKIFGSLMCVNRRLLQLMRRRVIFLVELDMKSTILWWSLIWVRVVFKGIKYTFFIFLFFSESFKWKILT